MRIPSFFAALSIGLAVLAPEFATTRRSMGDEVHFPKAFETVQRCLTEARPIIQSIQASQKALTDKQVDAIGVVAMLKDSESAGHLVRGIDLQRVKIGDPLPVRTGAGHPSPPWLSVSYPAALALAKLGLHGASAAVRAAADDAAPSEIRLKLYAEVVVRCLDEDQEFAAIFLERQRKHFALEPTKQLRLDKLMQEIKAVKGSWIPIAPYQPEKVDEAEKLDKSKAPGNR